MSGVDRGSAAALVGGPPGVELHTTVGRMPSGGVARMLPVVVTLIGEGMLPNGAAGAIATDDIIGVDVVMAGAPGIYVDIGPDTVDGTDTIPGTVEVSGGGAPVYIGTGMIAPGKTVAADVSGCWENVSG